MHLLHLGLLLLQHAALSICCLQGLEHARKVRLRLRHLAGSGRLRGGTLLLALDGGLQGLQGSISSLPVG